MNIIENNNKNCYVEMIKLISSYEKSDSILDGATKLNKNLLCENLTEYMAIGQLFDEDY